MDLDSALALVKRRRPVAEPIPAFVEQLKRYEGECKNSGLIHNNEKKQGVDGDSSNTPMINDVTCEKEGGMTTNPKKRKAEETKITIGPCRGPVGPQRQQKSKKVQGPSIGPSLPPSYKPTDDTEKQKGNNKGGKINEDNSAGIEADEKE